jgi:hypothetical protein
MPDRPEVKVAAFRRDEAIRLNPVALGRIALTPEQANTMVARSYRALVVGFDRLLLQSGCAAAIEDIFR